MDQPNSNQGAPLDRSINGGVHLGSGAHSITGGANLGSSVADVVGNGQDARATASNQAQAPNAQATQAAPQARQTSRGRNPDSTGSSNHARPPKVTLVKGPAQRERSNRSVSPSDDDPRRQLGIHSRRGETQRPEDEHDAGCGRQVVNNYTFHMSLASGYNDDDVADAVRRGVETAHSLASGQASTESYEVGEVDIDDKYQARESGKAQLKQSSKAPTTQSQGRASFSRPTTPVGDPREAQVKGSVKAPTTQSQDGEASGRSATPAGDPREAQAKESVKAPTTQRQGGKSSDRSTTPVGDPPSEAQAVLPTMGRTLVPVGSETATPADGTTDDAGDETNASDSEDDYDDVMDTSDDTGIAVHQPSTSLQLVQTSLEPALFNVITRIGGDPERAFEIRVQELDIPFSRHGVGLFSRVLDTITGNDEYQVICKKFGIHCGFAKIESFEVNLAMDGGVEAFVCDSDWSTIETLKRLRWYNRLKIIHSHINIIIDMLPV